MMNKKNSAFLVRTPNVCGGRLRIDGTRVTVVQIAAWREQGYHPEEIAELYPHLTPKQVYAALAYCRANREEIETDLAFEKKEAERLEQECERSKDRRYASSAVY